MICRGDMDLRTKLQNAKSLTIKIKEMKTEAHVREKIKEIEVLIEDELSHVVHPESQLNMVEEYDIARKALLWVLYEKQRIEPDELSKKIKWEIMCFESTKIF